MIQLKLVQETNATYFHGPTPTTINEKRYEYRAKGKPGDEYDFDVFIKDNKIIELRIGDRRFSENDVKLLTIVYDLLKYNKLLSN